MNSKKRRVTRPPGKSKWTDLGLKTNGFAGFMLVEGWKRAILASGRAKNPAKKGDYTLRSHHYESVSSFRLVSIVLAFW